MSRWSVLAAAVVAVGVGVGDGRAEWPTMRARPKPLPGIPTYPYQTTSPLTAPKPLATGTSLPRLTVGTDPDPLRAPTPAELGTTTTVRETTTTRAVAGRCRGERVERTERVTTTTTGVAGSGPVDTTVATFSLLDQVIRVDHCTLSKVSVALYPDGKFVVAFRADQNPQPADPLARTLTARGTGIDTGLDPVQFRRNKFFVTVRGYAADPLGERGIGATKTAVLELPVEPFWVNRGEPYTGLVEGTSEAVRRNYKLVERVDVDFTYR
jgi:hypothetical protein